MNIKYFNNLNSYNSYIIKNNLNFFCIFSLNIRSVSSLSKFNRFRYELSRIAKLPDIITIQETWFSKECIQLYSLPGYQEIHCCRSDGFGGNSVFVKSEVRHRILLNCSESYVDSISIQLSEVKIANKPLVIYSIYRSQKCCIEIFFFKS